MTTTVPTATIDQFNALPAACRCGGGRSHDVYWRATDPSPLTDPATARFAFRTVEPERTVNFGRKRLTFAFHSVRTGHVQQGEGPWELLLAKHLETTPDGGPYRLHGHRAWFTHEDGSVTTYGPDAVWCDANGHVVCGEVKASDTYFTEPATAALLTAVEKGLATAGIRLARITGDALCADRRRRFNVCRAFADGLGRLDVHIEQQARDVLAGGSVPLARLGERLEVADADRVRVVNSLLVRRVASYDLSAGVTPDLEISAARPIQEDRRLESLTI